MAAMGRERSVRSGEILIEQSDGAIPFFVVVSGELEAVRPTSTTETLITGFSSWSVHGWNQHALGASCARTTSRTPAGEVIELSRENALSVVQTESKENASCANERRRVEGRSCPEFVVRVFSLDRIASSFGLLVIHPERALRWESLPRADAPTSEDPWAVNSHSPTSSKQPLRRSVRFLPNIRPGWSSSGANSAALNWQTPDGDYLSRSSDLVTVW